MSFGMSSMHARVVLSIPARLYFPHAVPSCGFVGVVRAVTFCNYCCNCIGFHPPNAKFCHDRTNSPPVEHLISMKVSPFGQLIEGTAVSPKVAERSRR
jgi:hypothetical protein